MTVLNIARLEGTFQSEGTRKQESLRFALLGTFNTKHDNVRFNNGEDIAEYSISVKSAKFTLTSANLNGSTVEEKVADFIARDNATTYAYVSNDYVAYIMNSSEFAEMVNRFHYVDTNRNTIRMNETKKLIKWLEARAV